MSYQSRVQCDRCGLSEQAPHDGGFPHEWVEINFKPSLRGMQGGDKTRRRHICKNCRQLFDQWMEAGGVIEKDTAA